MPDRQLIAACLENQPAAWGTLLHRYKRMIYGVSVRFGLEPDDRHEVFQTVCLEILKNLRSLRELDRLRSWILTITIRECNDSIRKKIRERRVFTADSVEPDQSFADTLNVYASAEREESLRVAIEGLSAQCRKLIQLLFLDEEAASYADVGKELGISKESIGSARQRCLDRLRKLLEAQDQANE